MNLLKQNFNSKNINISQILLTLEDTEKEDEQLMQKEHLKIYLN